ncbi:MAG TPA: DUF4145 domain-containing protein [Methanotrichaceae archaeon]|nr:DUF4145 domain-containing protein [Methanotrichaceae archaeon]
MSDYIAPELKKDAFNCPHCGAYAHQKWYETEIDYCEDIISLEEIDADSGIQNRINVCARCENYALWVSGKMVYPQSSAPLPVDDMPPEVKGDFLEARNVIDPSPRAAAALLRLALEKLVTNHLEAKGNTLNDKIGYLVKQQGLPPKIQQSLDAVRVIGNNAVHPGQIDLTDNKEIAISLFKLLNIIVEKIITEPQKIDEIYEIIPESAKKGINVRDGNG